VSFTLDPMLSSRWYDPAVETNRQRRGLARLFEAFDNWFLRLRDVYEKSIAFSLRHRGGVTAVSLILFAASLVVFDRLGQDFMPSYDRGEFQVSFKTNPGSALEQTEHISNEVMRVIAGKPGVDYTFTTIGAGSTSALNEGVIYVKLKPASQRPLSDAQLRDQLRSEFAEYGRATISLEDVADMGDSRPLQMSVKGPAVAEIDRISAEVAGLVRSVPARLMWIEALTGTNLRSRSELTASLHPISALILNRWPSRCGLCSTEKSRHNLRMKTAMHMTYGFGLRINRENQWTHSVTLIC